MKGKKLDTETFIDRASKVHDNKYDYSDTIYKRSSEKISYVCERHGIIHQMPNDHLIGKGCRYCSRNQKTEKELLLEMKEIHPTLNFSKFTYNYQSNKSTFEVTCTVCSTVFYPCISNLINQKSGCPKCGGNKQKNTIDFINESKEIHGDRFDYSNVTYTNAHGIINIFCNEHKENFFIPAFHHLKGRGCIICSTENNSSYAVQRIENKLSEYNIKFSREHKFDDCKNILPLRFDFFIESLNLCIEYDGAQHYKPVKHWGGDDEFEIIKKRDVIKNKYCEDNNINLLRLRYDEKYIEKLTNYLKVKK